VGLEHDGIVGEHHGTTLDWISFDTHLVPDCGTSNHTAPVESGAVASTAAANARASAVAMAVGVEGIFASRARGSGGVGK
jgi:hypothetical protein